MYKTKLAKYSTEGITQAKAYELFLSLHCKHAANDEYYGKPFFLEKWQRENIWKPILASGSMEQGEFIRKYRRALIGLPRGYGKTELIAGLLLTIASMEVRYLGQYGVVAYSKDQAKNLFGKIAAMVKMDEDLSNQWLVLKDCIRNKETGAQIMVFANKADALQGWHFNVLIFDELHVYKDDTVWAAGLTGQKVIKNSLCIGITTASHGREGFLWNLFSNLAPKDEAMYTYWLGLDDGDDMSDARTWRKLMLPSWVTSREIKDQRQQATTDSDFDRYTMNRFPQKLGSENIFKDAEIKACARKDEGFDFDKPFALGVDGALSGDCFALVGYQQREGVGYACEWIFDTPDESGYYPLAVIEELIADLFTRYDMPFVAIDPARLLLLANHLSDIYRLPVVGIAQNNANMCQATSLVINAVRNRELSLKGCQKLPQHLLNCTAEVREPFGVRIGKMDKRHKIDGAIALSLAMLVYQKQMSGYEDMVWVG